MNKLLFITIFLTFISCSKSEETHIDFLDCEEINEHYKLYSGENIDCQFHFVLTEFQNEEYIELMAHCADLTRTFVLNKSCIDICQRSPSNDLSECAKYLEESEVIRIHLIRK